MAVPYIMFIEQIIADGRMDEYLPIILENARDSSNEPGCVRFDVLHSDENPGSVFLYEVYVDEAAFDAHRKTAHYARFATARQGLVLESRRKRFMRLQV